MFNFWRRRRATTKCFNVVLLDGATVTLQLESRCTGDELIRQVLETQRILSNQEIFGLTVLTDNSTRRWLYLHKPLKKQISGYSPYTVYLCVWMYPRDHHSLLQSATRHHLYLQTKQDVYHNRLKVSNTSVLQRLAGLIVQRELGDFDQHNHGNSYLHEINVVPNLNTPIEQSICQQHRLTRGCPPRDCEEQVLNIAQAEFTYGTHSYTVQNAQSQRSTLQLSVCPFGIRIMTNDVNTPITYEWNMIERLRHKGKSLLLDLYHCDTKAPPPNGPTHFSCPSSQLASNIAYWCSCLKDCYSQGETPHKSKLKRFFSSRRSMRRRLPVENSRRASNPVVDRSASLDNEQFSATLSSNRISTSLLSSKSESQGLVVYGASGLASSKEISPLAEPAITMRTRAHSEEPHMSYQVNHFNRERINASCDPIGVSYSSVTLSRESDSQSHDSMSRSHDWIPSVHAPDSPEVKTLATLPHHSNNSLPTGQASNTYLNSTPKSCDIHVTIPEANCERRASCRQSREYVHRVHRSESSQSHNNHMFKHFEIGPPSKRGSIKDQSSVSLEHVSVNRRSSDLGFVRSFREPSPKSTSLPVHTNPDYTLTEEQEWQGHQEASQENGAENTVRVIDPAAKPKNRIRLSLPESSFYDSQSRRGHRLSISSRRARNTTISSVTSLSQPVDSTNLGVLSSKLGSIASLDAQATFAELSQAESTSYLDPHMRSFVFQASQPTAGTEL